MFLLPWMIFADGALSHPAQAVGKVQPFNGAPHRVNRV